MNGAYPYSFVTQNCVTVSKLIVATVKPSKYFVATLDSVASLFAATVIKESMI